MLRLCDGWNIQSCKAYFTDSARRAFAPRTIQKYFKGIPWLHSLMLACSLLLTDSKYPSENLDSLLQDEYGTARSIMDCSTANEMGIMFGIILTTVRGTDTVVASNYNGVGENRKSSGKVVSTSLLTHSDGVRL